MEADRINEEFGEWLRSAHVTKEQAEKMLEAPSGRIENYPEISAGIDRHLAEPPVCTEIRREEAAMADQLAGLLPQVATTYLQRSARDMAQAKR